MWGWGSGAEPAPLYRLLYRTVPAVYHFPAALTVAEDVGVVGLAAIQVHPIQDFGSGACGGHVVAVWSHRVP